MVKLGKSFKAAMNELGYLSLGIVCSYQLRHGGASQEAVDKFRTAQEIQNRLRVKCNKTLKRYENGGRLADVFGRLRPAQQLHAMAAASSIGKILCGTLPPVRPGTVR